MELSDTDYKATLLTAYTFKEIKAKLEIFVRKQEVRHNFSCRHSEGK